MTSCGHGLQHDLVQCGAAGADASSGPALAAKTCFPSNGQRRLRRHTGQGTLRNPGQIAFVGARQKPHVPRFLAAKNLALAPARRISALAAPRRFQNTYAPEQMNFEMWRISKFAFRKNVVLPDDRRECVPVPRYQVRR